MSAMAQKERIHLSQLAGLRKQIFITIAIAVLAQFSGHNGILYYTESVCVEAGYSGRAGVPSLIYGTVTACVSSVSSLLVDRLGRKVMLVTGALGMAVSLASLGIYFYELDNAPSAASQIDWLPIACIIAYAVSFGTGWGAIPPLIVSEIFPLNARGFGNTLYLLLANLLSFVVTLIFLPLQSFMTPQGVFWLFACDCVLCALFCGLVLPETARRSLEDINVGDCDEEELAVPAASAQ